MNAMADRVAEKIWLWLRLGMKGCERMEWSALDPGCLAVEITTDCARAAIGVMREPTFEMLAAGCAAHPNGSYAPDTSLGAIVAAEHRAMIDAALK